MISLIRASLKNRLIVGLTTLAVAVFGIIAMNSLKQELMPPITAPMATVSVTSPGLAPEQMSHSVAEPLERALMSIPNVKNVVTTISTGSVDMQVDWAFGQDDDAQLQAVRRAVDTVKVAMPRGTETVVFSGGSDGIPAMMVSIGSTGDEEGFADRVADTVVPAVQGVAGVQRAELQGRTEQRIVIELRPEDVVKHQVTPESITLLLQGYGASLPAGEALREDGKISVTVGQALTTLEEIRELPVTGAEGIVKLSDFADVTLQDAPISSISRVNGNEALTLLVMPAQGANVVELSHAVNAEFERLAPIVGAEFVSLFDQAPYIEQSIHDLTTEGGLGLLFAVLVILAFLGSWRSTIIAAVSIPLSLLITMIALLWTDNTLNIFTLGALTIAIGRVVDDSIVVIENINRRRGTGRLTVEEVVASVRQVAGAIIASTLTAVAVFLPIAFVTGITGQLFRPFAITASISLLASLLVALTVVPVLAFWFIRGSDKRKQRATTASEVALAEQQANDPAAAATPETLPAAHQASADAAAAPSDLDEIHTPADRLQRALMPPLNATRRHPVITLIAASVILVLTFGMSSLIRSDFLGSSGAEQITVTQELPESQRDDAIAAAEKVERALAGVTGVRDVLTTIPVAAAGTPVRISYEMMLTTGSDTTVAIAEGRAAVAKIPNAGEVEFATYDSFAGAGGITLQIRGKDPAALREASDLLEKQLKGAPGVDAVSSNLKGEQPVLRVELDELAAAKLGFDPNTVAQAIRTALEGEQIGQLMLEGAERVIVLRTAGSSSSAAELSQLLLPVTPQQTAEARKAASDKLAAEAEAEALQEQNRASAELATQLSQARTQRAELNAQLDALQSQLRTLQNAPLQVDPLLPPDQEALLRAQRERAAQIAELEGAISGVREGISAADAQIDALVKSQHDMASARERQEQAKAAQEAALKVAGTPIPLSAIATVTEELTPPSITRANGERQVTLTVTPKAEQFEIANYSVQQAIEKTELPAGVSFDIGGVSAEQDEAFGQLGAAMLAAIVLVLLVMVATFRSFRGPLILLISVPFAATGALLGLLLTDTPLGLPAMIGLLMLIGIVVTNAIVLMDLIGKLREAGATLEEAVEHGTRLRLRPILMTAAATIFALVPMALGFTGGGVFISKPLAVVVIGGLVSSTLLTLVLVPILYTLFERRVLRKREKRAAKRAAKAARRAEREAGAQGEEFAQLGIDTTQTQQS